ncbi:5-amino-6-(5-phosphoribosylamino)uracil reductase homolog [Rhodococcus aetherivorans]|uniref:5-amino-6-(5-phosphoribosylamino)uracil reductase homolog n=1 Tax=Rhodococcus aetherivorans TaxID=191292 RepID=A0ABQ0YLV9_9NOCA|nr:pyrimidine reductase family protein [Rhodococcus aetherivorans]ETT28099.1 bifunctional deaminase-reductase domain protein [Rhodococcus rhodochrous ATCC 21198]KDE15109.1 5-amino-6-(5-phosphoribosylamino)uracil reductase [Rhodococcus aetherivorans]MDV6294451.1 pyrimidine reductase family protein [Rhodococcus aetherivorans]NGP27663.1 pyrimidine reductase family protein [Rhodococcus aetherivorans]GES37556.1 5-amino-6-(5-phosphoribosylamino)uracil reductase homolog [Rhodococcus aetherivorans]
MRRLDDPTCPARPLDDDELRALYAYPADLRSPWVRVNFVSSLDGAVAVEGRSGGLGTPSDKKVFGLLRGLADVIVVGAGTARGENYGGARTSAALRERRLEAGLSEVPPVAVVTATCHLDPGCRLFTDTTVAPVVLTCETAPGTRRRSLAAAGADVRVIAEHSIDGHAVRDALAAAGWTRALCEGGPRLFGQLIADGVVDDLCLTLAPLLAAGPEGRIATAPQTAVTSMRPAHVLADDDGTVLTRWIRGER